MSKEAHSAGQKGGSEKGDWHVSNTSMGMGDYYGVAVKAKVGRMVDGYGQNSASPKQLKTPPKSLA